MEDFSIEFQTKTVPGNYSWSINYLKWIFESGIPYLQYKLGTSYLDPALLIFFFCREAREALARERKTTKELCVEVLQHKKWVWKLVNQAKRAILTGKRVHIVSYTLLPTQMFLRLPPRATFVGDTNFESGTQKMFLILFRNILCPQQMFPSLRSPRNIMGNNVSATTCPRLPGP